MPRFCGNLRDDMAHSSVARAKRLKKIALTACNDFNHQRLGGASPRTLRYVPQENVVIGKRDGDNNHNGQPRQDDTSSDEIENAQLSDHFSTEQETPVPPAGTMRAGEAGSRPDSDEREWVIETGCDVIGSCGHKVGEIVDVEPTYVVVEVGFFHPSDLYVPKAAIGDLSDDDVHLNVTKSEALHHGWDVEPAS